MKLWRAFLAGCRGFRRAFIAEWRNMDQTFSGRLRFWSGGRWREEHPITLAEYKTVLAERKRSTRKGEGWLNGVPTDRWGV